MNKNVAHHQMMNSKPESDPKMSKFPISPVFGGKNWSHMYKHGTPSVDELKTRM